MTDSRSDATLRTVTVGVLLLAGGLAINYLLERRNIFAIWERSAYPVSWVDVFYPPLCVFLALTGIVLVVGGIMERTTVRQLRRHTMRIAIPLTILYALFSFGMQFIATGADQIGECAGLNQAASSSNVIPDSKRRPGRPAVGCAVERRGIFLSIYNDVWVYGVTDMAAQQHVLDALAERSRQAHTHPVQVMFYQKENWLVRYEKNGVTIGSGGPSKLIRVVNIG
jgi:hypothetical protein